jgi:hypothetical protein
MSTNSSKLLHIPGPIAAALATHIDGPASNADTISRMGIPGPIAIEIARQMKAGARYSLPPRAHGLLSTSPRFNAHDRMRASTVHV